MNEDKNERVWRWIAVPKQTRDLVKILSARDGRKMHEVTTLAITLYHKLTTEPEDDET